MPVITMSNGSVRASRSADSPSGRDQYIQLPSLCSQRESSSAKTDHLQPGSNRDLLAECASATTTLDIAWTVMSK